MADQVYVTHCLQSDSVNNQAGFGVRAASTDDAELLKFAADYPAYELPLEMWTSEPSPAQTPRRLAMLSAPHGKIALVHSAFVGEDTMGRSGNFFTHVIFYPRLSAIDALASWGAAEWRTAYPAGAPKKLAELSDRPIAGSLIDADALTAFLAGKSAGKNQNLATVVCPERLRDDPARCQTLLAKTLDACLAAWDDGPSAARGRVYLAGEPGLLALLLYGVARLLPPSAAANLTFSTFENAHRALRHFRSAFACGTYSSDPHKSIDADYFKSRGYGLDTFAPERCSPELAGESSSVVRELVRLAAEGKWDVIRQLQECHAAETVSADSLRSALKGYNIFAKAKKGRLTADELVDYYRTPAGQTLILKRQAVFWPLIVDFSSADAAVCRQFGDLIRQRASELSADAGRKLAALQPDWTAPWTLLKSVEPAKERLAAQFLGILKAAAGADASSRPFIAGQRVVLLREWQHVWAGAGALPEPIRALLAVGAAEEFDRMQKAGLPAEWLGEAMLIALSAAPTPAWPVAAVGAAPESLLAAFAARLSEQPPAQMLRTLRILVPSQDAYPLLFRLLKSGLATPPDVIAALLDALGDAKKSLSRTWYRGDGLATLLGALAGRPEDARPIWDRFTRFLNRDLLLGDAGQKALFDSLAAARQQCSGSVPAASAQCLNDWAFLVQWINDPDSLAGGKETADTVCKRRGLGGADGLLGDIFVKTVQQRPVDDPQVESFTRSFEMCYPAGDVYADHLARFDAWLRVVAACADAKKTAYFQLYYLERRVPVQFRWRICKERSGVIDKRIEAAVAKSVAEQNAREAAAAEAVPQAAVATGSPRLRRYVELGIAAGVGMLVGIVLILIATFLDVVKSPRRDLEGKIKESSDELALLRPLPDEIANVRNDLVSQKRETEKARSELPVALAKAKKASDEDAKKKMQALSAEHDRLVTEYKQQLEKALAMDAIEPLSIPPDFIKQGPKSVKHGVPGGKVKLDVLCKPESPFQAAVNKDASLSLSLKKEKKAVFTIKLADADVVVKAEEGLKLSTFPAQSKSLGSDVQILLMNGNDIAKRYSLKLDPKQAGE